MKKILNGIDVNQLNETIEKIKADPGLARFTFRAETTWVNGAQCRTKIQGFSGAGSEDTSRSRPFLLASDEPTVLLGSDTGPNAVEMILTGLGSCLAVGFAYHAAAAGIRVESLDLEMEGDIDLQGFLGISDKVRPGYQDIRLSCRVKSDAPRERVMELLEHVRRTSPVMDIVRNAVPVTVKIERKESEKAA